MEDARTAAASVSPLPAVGEAVRARDSKTIDALMKSFYLPLIDLRDRNSWRLTLAEVSLVELLETQLVHAVASLPISEGLNSTSGQRKRSLPMVMTWPSGSS